METYSKQKGDDVKDTLNQLLDFFGITSQEDEKNPLLKEYDSHEKTKEFKELQENPFIVLEEKFMLIGQLMGHISNGGGVLHLGGNIYVQFIANGSKFINVRVLQKGKGGDIKTQTWVKSKKVIEKQIVHKPSKKNAVKPKKNAEVIKYKVAEEEEI